MARPWREDKPRGPRPTFHKKDKPAKAAPVRATSAAGAADPFRDGKVRLFLDDERKCPPGWTLVKNVKEFTDALDAVEPSEIACISLDWYLGVGVVDGMGAAQALADRFRERRAEFTSLELVTCHSSDIEKAAAMARLIAAALPYDDTMPYIGVDVGRPGQTLSGPRR